MAARGTRRVTSARNPISSFSALCRFVKRIGCFFGKLGRDAMTCLGLGKGCRMSLWLFFFEFSFIAMGTYLRISRNACNVTLTIKALFFTSGKAGRQVNKYKSIFYLLIHAF